MRILVLGASGRLGRTLGRIYTALSLPVTTWGRAQLDLTLSSQIPERLADTSFDVLINAAGLTSVDGCEIHQEEARLSNAVAPGLLAAFCAARGRRFIHISSDYVFDGLDPRPRRESDPAVPCNHYGLTKLMGEHAALAANPASLIVRVSWLFGPDKPSFPDMILRTALDQSSVSAVNDKWSSPSFSDDLASWLLTLIKLHPHASGLLHLCNQGAPSWQEYGQAALDIAARLGLPLKCRQVSGHSMHGFTPFIARRPPHTALDTGTFQRLTGIQPRPWQHALEDYIKSYWLNRS